MQQDAEQLKNSISIAIMALRNATIISERIAEHAETHCENITKIANAKSQMANNMFVAKKNGTANADEVAIANKVAQEYGEMSATADHVREQTTSIAVEIAVTSAQIEGLAELAELTVKLSLLKTM